MAKRQISITTSELAGAQQEALAWDAARRRCGLLEDNCPADALSTIEYARKFGKKPATALNEIQRMLEAGMLNSGQAMRPDARGRRAMTTVYWPKDAKC